RHVSHLYLQALALTLIVEVPAYTGFLGWVMSIPAHHAMAGGATINLVSHPVAFLLVMPQIAPRLGYLPALVVAEVGVWIFESSLLLAWLRRDADLLGAAALLANSLSLSVGLALLS
ncbi:MAG: hypothetical protein WBM00_02525, partial [Solirubrobacterales bacterium]